MGLLIIIVFTCLYLQSRQAFIGGKIKFKGNMTMLMKFQSLQPKLEKLRSKY